MNKKLTKQGVPDLNDPGSNNPSRIRKCRHKWGKRQFIRTGYDMARGDYAIHGRPCLYCPEYLEDHS